MQLRNGASQPIQCQECRDQLQEYVRQELAQQPVATLFAAVTRHLQSCLDCEEAYDVEFRRQGLLLTMPELQALGHRAAVAQVMDHITQQAQAVPATWSEALWEYGRSWRDEVTGSWRQVELLLSCLSGPQAKAPALAGLLDASHEADEAEDVGSTLHAAPEDAQFDLRVVQRRQREENSHCQLEVVITLYDRFGDYSGVEVTLQTENRVEVATTNPLGKVEFSGLNCAEMDDMRLLIRIPEEQDSTGAASMG